MSDLDRLIRFAAVAEELSFSRAAKRLRVDQPWLSRQIQQLEAQLGFALFVRSTRKVTLTPEGQALLAHASEFADSAERMREAVRNLGRSYSSIIAFGANPYTFWVPGRARLLEQFQARHPRARVELSSNYTPRLLSKLRKRTLDAIIIPGPFTFSDLEALVIHRSAPSLLVPAEDPLARQPEIELAQVLGKRIATTDPRLNPAAHAAVYGPFFDAGAEPAIIRDGQSAIGYYARAERLLMVCLSWPDSEMAVPPDFVHVPIAPPVHAVEYAVLRRKEPPRRLLDQFWAVAREITQDLDPDARQAA